MLGSLRYGNLGPGFDARLGERNPTHAFLSFWTSNVLSAQPRRKCAHHLVHGVTHLRHEASAHQLGACPDNSASRCIKDVRNLARYIPQVYYDASACQTVTSLNSDRIVRHHPVRRCRILCSRIAKQLTSYAINAFSYWLRLGLFVSGFRSIWPVLVYSHLRADTEGSYHQLVYDGA